MSKEPNGISRSAARGGTKLVGRGAGYSGMEPDEGLTAEFDDAEDTMEGKISCSIANAPVSDRFSDERRRRLLEDPYRP